MLCFAVRAAMCVLCSALLCSAMPGRFEASSLIPLVLYPAKGPRHGSVHGPLTTKIPEPDDPTSNVTTARPASSTLQITCLRPVEVAGVAVSRIHMHGLPQRVDLICCTVFLPLSRAIESQDLPAEALLEDMTVKAVNSPESLSWWWSNQSLRARVC
jgi:hypothetical protein